MAKIYISFDDYYDVREYNSFLTAAKNNKVDYEEFVRVRAPFKRYIYIDEEHIPNFLNYEIADSGTKRWLVSVCKPRRPNEAYSLLRREGQDVSYYNYILPIPFRNINEEKYILIFRGQDITTVKNASRSANTKIFKWGRAKIKNFRIFVTFNPYVKNFIPGGDILLEYKDGSSNPVPKVHGDIEADLNNKILIKEKLMNKGLELEYYENGMIYPLKKLTFI